MDSLPQQLLLQAVLIFLNAFFAATEIAVLSVNQAVVRQDAESGDRKAKKIVKMIDEPAGFLSTIQIGITLAGFLGSAFAADNFSEYLVNWVYNDLGMTGISPATLDVLAVIVITLILSYITLIAGELVPKRIAMQKPYGVARFTCGPVMAVAVVMKPVVMFLSLSTNAVLRLLRMRTDGSEDEVTEEEIRMMVKLGGQKGVLEQAESNWISNVFDFNDITVEEVMTQRADMVSVDTDDDPEKILEIIRENRYSRMPVYNREEDKVYGILHVNDFLLADDRGRAGFMEMLRPVYYVSENMKTSELFEKMQKSNRHMAVVVDEYGAVSGLATMEDLLEEIVGNIYDETDIPEEDEIVKLDDESWKVKGECPIRKFEAAAGIQLSVSDRYRTMGGAVLDSLETIPSDGTQITVENDQLIMEITKVENRHVEEMIIRIKKHENTEE